MILLKLYLYSIFPVNEHILKIDGIILIKNGYIMVQFSIYLKSFNHQINLNDEVLKINKYIPKSGNIRALSLTEHQWSNAVFICGEKQINELVNNSERFNKI